MRFISKAYPLKYIILTNNEVAYLSGAFSQGDTCFSNQDETRLEVFVLVKRTSLELRVSKIHFYRIGHLGKKFLNESGRRGIHKYSYDNLMIILKIGVPLLQKR